LESYRQRQEGRIIASITTSTNAWIELFDSNIYIFFFEYVFPVLDGLSFTLCLFYLYEYCLYFTNNNSRPKTKSIEKVKTYVMQLLILSIESISSSLMCYLMLVDGMWSKFGLSYEMRIAFIPRFSGVGLCTSLLTAIMWEDIKSSVTKMQASIVPFATRYRFTIFMIGFSLIVVDIVFIQICRILMNNFGVSDELLMTIFAIWYGTINFVICAYYMKTGFSWMNTLGSQMNGDKVLEKYLKKMNRNFLLSSFCMATFLIGIPFYLFPSTWHSPKYFPIINAIMDCSRIGISLTQILMNRIPIVCRVGTNPIVKHNCFGLIKNSSRKVKPNNTPPENTPPENTPPE
jgi:hypothetical protein